MSKSVERSLPFFKALRGAKDFKWTDECQKAFDDLKAYLRELPLLTRPIEGESLYMYLGVSSTAVSAVLFRKDELGDLPVFYVNKVLLDTETRYPLAERVALALVMAA